jgi:hypothetical protein
MLAKTRVVRYDNEAKIQPAGIAQLVEQRTENPRVPSSNLGLGILLLTSC